MERPERITPTETLTSLYEFACMVVGELVEWKERREL